MFLLISMFCIYSITTHSHDLLDLHHTKIDILDQRNNKEEHKNKAQMLIDRIINLHKNRGITKELSEITESFLQQFPDSIFAIKALHLLLESKAMSREWDGYNTTIIKCGGASNKPIHLMLKTTLGEKLQTLIKQFNITFDKKTGEEIGRLLIQSRQYEKSLPYLQYAKSTLTASAAYMLGLSVENYAEHKYQKIVNEKTDEIVTKELIDKGKKFFEESRLDLAKIHYLKALQQTLNTTQKKRALKSVGIVFFLEKNYRESINRMLEFISLSKEKEQAEALYYIALSYIKLEEKILANPYLQKIIDNYPHSTWEKKAMVSRKDIQMIENVKKSL